MLVYIFLQALRVYLITEHNFPHVLIVLFQKTPTVQHILTPSIFDIMDMPLLYSISSLKSMTDMCGSSDFRLGGGGGVGGQDRI